MQRPAKAGRKKSSLAAVDQNVSGFGRVGHEKTPAVAGACITNIYGEETNLSVIVK